MGAATRRTLAKTLHCKGLTASLNAGAFWRMREYKGPGRIRCRQLGQLFSGSLAGGRSGAECGALYFFKLDSGGVSGMSGEYGLIVPTG
jgi:hypothetical protein